MRGIFSSAKLEQFLREKNYLPKNFSLLLSNNPIDTMWRNLFGKTSKYGTINPYNGLSVSVDELSGKIIFLKELKNIKKILNRKLLRKKQ